MKRVFSLIFVFVLLFALVSCGGGKKEKPAEPTEEPTEPTEEKPDEEQSAQEISAEKGGIFTSSDESVSIDVPAGALESDTLITMKIYDAEDYAGTDGLSFVTKVVEFEPSGLVFKKPVIITMKTVRDVRGEIVTAAVYRDSKGEWSFSEHGAYAVLAGRNEAGDPIMTSAAGDPIMLNAAGDPIMTNAAGDPIMLAAAGDPIMLASAGDPIMTNAAGDPIMNAAAGDPIMMTTGHFTAYAFIALPKEEPLEEPDEKPENDEEITDEDDDVSDIEITEDDDEIPDEIEDEDETPDVDEDIVVPEPDPVLSKVLCTGQIHCSDGYSLFECPEKGEPFYGQDAQFIAQSMCVPHKYEWSEFFMNEDTGQYFRGVVDENTGLKWLMLEERATWENAKARCEALTYGGYEWRLPTMKELLSITDHDRYSPALNSYYFRNLSDEVFWSSTPNLSETEYDEMWVLYSGNGGTNAYSLTSTSPYIACVSGGEYGRPGVFEVKNTGGDEVVFDSTTNLMWQKTYFSGEDGVNWGAALAYCENLEYAGYTDWRLPNKNELATLVDYSRVDPASSFPEMSSSAHLWSSTFTSGYGGADSAFLLEIGEGNITNYPASNEYYAALCVRSDAKPLPAGRTVPYCDESRATPCEDAATGKIWSKPDYSKAYDELWWQTRAVQCRESNEGGISQWRLPTIDEIRTLLPSSDRLKTGGECNVTAACSDYYSSVCFDSFCSASGDWTMSSLFDYDGYYISGTLSGQGEESEELTYSWAVNLLDGSLNSFGNGYGNSESRCIKDDSIPTVSFPYTDPETHLVWSSQSKYSYYWYVAAAYCKDLVEGGSNNWRVPTMDELRTLVRNCPEGNCGPDPAGRYSVFGDLSDFWSSTADGNFHSFSFMNVSESAFSDEYYYKKVRCVRSGDEPATVSEINFPFEINDLMWSKVSEDTYYGSDADDYCASLNEENYGGRNDWSVPTIAELATLIRKSVCTNKSEFMVSSPGYRRCDIYTFDGYSILGDMMELRAANNYSFDFARGRTDTYNSAQVRCVVRFDDGQ